MTITIHKCDMNGTIQVSYDATIVFQSSKKIVVDTYFSYKKNFCIGGLTLNNGDRCIEAFYYDRWYNIFEVYTQNSDELKGWYCNITKPFCYKNGNIYYYDLALDLIVL